MFTCWAEGRPWLGRCKLCTFVVVIFWSGLVAQMTGVQHKANSCNLKPAKHIKTRVTLLWLPASSCGASLMLHLCHIRSQGQSPRLLSVHGLPVSLPAGVCMMLFNALYATPMLLPICFELGDIGKADKMSASVL